MALVTRPHPASSRTRNCRAFIALAGCMVLSACAQGNKSATELLSLNAKPDPSDEQSAGQPATQVVDHSVELKKATEYWGKEYAKNPRELQPALNFARNLKAMGEKQRALAVLQQSAMFHGQSRELANEYGRLALDLDQVSLANRLLAIADDPANPDWRVISARGTVLAKQGKYSDAIPYYERALTLAHDHPSVLSNLALAHAMNGEPARAEAMLRQAAATDRDSLKIRQNLALVLGLQGKYAEAKLLASRDLSPEGAAENTEYLRRIVKLAPNTPPTGEASREATQLAEKPANPIDAREAPQVTGAVDKTQAEAKAESAQGRTAPASLQGAAIVLPQDGFSEPDVDDAQLTMNFAQHLPSDAPTPVRAPSKPGTIGLAPSVR